MYGLDRLPVGAYLPSLLSSDVYFQMSGNSFIVEELRVSCSHLCITNLYLANKQRFKKLLKSFVDWAYKNNYTKVFASTSYPNHLEFLKEIGFKQVGRPYKSRRTENMIYWLQGDLTKMKELLK